jgi:hypothetical protein
MSTEYELVTRPTALWRARTKRTGRREVTTRWIMPRRRST